MTNLKDFIIESLLDDEEEIGEKIDLLADRPLLWFFQESRKCKSLTNLISTLEVFKNRILKYSSEIKPVNNNHKTGILSKYWYLSSLKLSPNDLYFIFNDIDMVLKEKHESIILRMGYKRDRLLHVIWDAKNNQCRWYIDYDKMWNNSIALNTQSLFYFKNSILNPCSEDYKEIIKIVN